MTRARKLTLSVEEFSHLVSESLEITQISPPPQSLVTSTLLTESPLKTPRTSIHRVFSRPSFTTQHRENFSQDVSSDVSRKMIAWPFSRSARKNRTPEDGDNVTNSHPVSPYSVTSRAAASTSTLGSLVSTHECIFHVASRDSDEANRNSDSPREAAPPSPVTVPSQVCEAPAEPDHYAVAAPSDPIFGNGSTASVCASDSHNAIVELGSPTSFEDSDASHSAVYDESETLDEDPTPRASTFAPQPLSPSFVQRGRLQGLSLILSSQSMDILSLRPAVGVTPHVPSETESSASLYSPSSPTSPVERIPSPTFPETSPSGSGTTSLHVPATPPNPRIHALFPDNSSRSDMECPPASPFSPRPVKRILTRSLTPPPLSRPPPTGPLPAVPSSIPPVPPLPPALSKIPVNMTISSPPRSTTVPTNPATALPPSPPGALRLPSRLSWVNSVRAVLPSPPASPPKLLKPLSSKTPASPSKAEKKRASELKRPTSIGVIEAADNVHVRRTKSILLLGSRSKSTASLGPKRVQIHADVDANASESRRQRRKSSGAVIDHPVSSSDSGPLPMRSSEILVPRERRHSAPLLSSNTDPNGPVPSADWTLSLPFCTDVPGNLLSPLLMAQSEQSLEDENCEDWTLCMPLKLSIDMSTTGASESCESESAPTESVESQAATQLPTPSPSPTSSTPRSCNIPLDSEEGMSTPADRPLSPASLGPHVGGLDLAGGCGKRGSGWHVYGWFDEVNIPEDEEEDVAPMATSFSDSKPFKTHVHVFRRTHDGNGKHPSRESMSTVSTSETVFYSARSSLLVH